MAKRKHHILGISAIVVYIFFAIGSTATSSHATYSDVFNSFSAASTPFIQAETNRLKQQNDQYLYQVKANLNAESSNYIRSLNFRYDYRNFSNEWYNLRDKLYNRALQQNTSQYVKRNLPYLFMDNDMEVVRIVGDIAHIKWQEEGKPGQSPSTSYRSLPGL